MLKLDISILFKYCSTKTALKYSEAYIFIWTLFLTSTWVYSILCEHHGLDISTWYCQLKAIAYQWLSNRKNEIRLYFTCTSLKSEDKMSYLDYIGSQQCQFEELDSYRKARCSQLNVWHDECVSLIMRHS